MIHYQQCPVCGESTIQPALEARDYTVSQQVFPIWECTACTLRFTQDVPEAEHIGPFYQSETYISHSDTREGLVNKLYHRIRSITLKKKKDLIAAVSGKTAGSLLDIGCGTGAFLHTMKSAGWQVRGLEPDAGARAKAAELYGLSVAPVDQLFSLPSGSFDVITMWHVLEHVHELKAYIDQCKKLLVPGGTLVIAVPNYTSADASHYGPYWAAYDVPRHLYHFSPKSMQHLLTQGGFTLQAMKPMVFDSFYVSMLSERYQHGKDRLVQAALTGLQSNLKASGKPEKSSSVIYIAKA
jgi:2-polyprenyl-3-methyl-5-hydroxy-6-metoxy-1,4-benzoquinol methylase